MINNRNQLKALTEELEESSKKYKTLLRNMFKLQEAYNDLKESAIASDKYESLERELIEVRKQLAVEKRGMSYSQVSDLLEGATTEEDIESRLSSLASLGRKRQTKLMINNSTLTEGAKAENDKRLSKLASIVSRV